MRASLKPRRIIQVVLFSLLTASPQAYAAATAVDQESIGRSVEKIKAFQDKVISEREFGAVVKLLEQARLQTESPSGIEYFRSLDDLNVIMTLVDMATSDNRGIRINATLILANVVDNTTLCAVINKLLSGNINDNSQYNLLQVVKVVAGYAREENRAWIKPVLERTNSLSLNKESYARTIALSDEITEILATSAPVDPLPLAQKYPDEYKACIALPNIAALLTPMGAPLEGKLGALSAKYEIGGREPGTVLSGIGDAGGVSYGSYLMTSRPNGGTVGRFVTEAAFPWRPRFAGLTPGGPEFSAAWKALAAEAPDPFFEAQHDFLKRLHYDPLVRKIRAEDGIDIDERSQPLQDAVWSTAVQHGPNTPVVHRAIVAAGGSQSLQPADLEHDRRLIVAIYAERGRRSDAGNLVYFARNSMGVQDEVARRFRDEESDALSRLDRLR
jgi:hypothetical protein